MRSIIVIGIAIGGLLAVTPGARAQEPPPPLPKIAVDIHGAVPMFPDLPGLALSRALTSQAELPGAGLGGDLAINFYPLRYRAVTFGMGARGLVARSHSNPAPVDSLGNELTPVTARFTYASPQLSLNFGSGTGWSYLSGGVGYAKWSIVPDNTIPLPPDEERLKTIDYGGGARWFAKPHVAFSFDVRFYAVSPTSAVGVLPAGPRTTFVVIGAGISLK